MGNKIPFNKIHNFIVYEIIDEKGNLLNNFDLPLLEQNFLALPKPNF